MSALFRAAALNQTSSGWSGPITNTGKPANIWTCVLCSLANFGPFCINCGRTREAASDKERWNKFMSTPVSVDNSKTT